MTLSSNLRNDEVNDKFYPLKEKSGITDLRILTKNDEETQYQSGDHSLEKLTCLFNATSVTEKKKEDVKVSQLFKIKPRRSLMEKKQLNERARKRKFTRENLNIAGFEETSLFSIQQSPFEE